jgi:hypothetical protein
MAQRGGRSIALLFPDLGARRGWVVSAKPRPLCAGKDPVPLYRRLGGPQGRSGRVRKMSLPLGFDPRTVQPVASPYTDSAILLPLTHRSVICRTGTYYRCSLTYARFLFRVPIRNLICTCVSIRPTNHQTQKI